MDLDGGGENDDTGADHNNCVRHAEKYAFQEENEAKESPEAMLAASARPSCAFHCSFSLRENSVSMKELSGFETLETAQNAICLFRSRWASIERVVASAKARRKHVKRYQGTSARNSRWFIRRQLRRVPLEVRGFAQRLGL